MVSSTVLDATIGSGGGGTGCSGQLRPWEGSTNQQPVFPSLQTGRSAPVPDCRWGCGHLVTWGACSSHCSLPGWGSPSSVCKRGPDLISLKVPLLKMWRPRAMALLCHEAQYSATGMGRYVRVFFVRERVRPLLAKSTKQIHHQLLAGGAPRSSEEFWWTTRTSPMACPGWPGPTVLLDSVAGKYTTPCSRSWGDCVGTPGGPPFPLQQDRDP